MKKQNEKIVVKDAVFSEHCETWSEHCETLSAAEELAAQWQAKGCAVDIMHGDAVHENETGFFVFVRSQE